MPSKAAAPFEFRGSNMFVLPDFIFLPMKWLTLFLVTIVFANLIYFTTLSIFGLKKPKRDYKIMPDQKKFVIVIPAHNEEAVIGATIQSLTLLLLQITVLIIQKVLQPPIQKLFYLKIHLKKMSLEASHMQSLNTFRLIIGVNTIMSYLSMQTIL